ncbi:MAG TPA: signal recognition particle protein [Candidatus Aciduliprofundum boonei]|uniref:Signal recognition particle 54 kDa protein n=1 Tax=Candidatus Aciduliprofundum boonei TaxID=379547 RepID=A0A7J3TAT3_9ARCH|nr:signal recognition particle protein [Candidatus Aciduliprofundum boonei]
MLDSLGASLRDTIRKITKAGYVDRSLIREVVRDIQRALLKGDVEVHLALKLSKNVERRALEEKPPSGMSYRDFLIKIIYEELVAILGKEKEIKLKPQKIMLVGLYGQGKTTTAGKLAKYFHNKGLSVALVACDTHRPAAYDQLKQLGEKLNIPVFGIPGEKDARKIARAALKETKDFQVKIFDTSGRHSLEDDLIKEMEELKKIIQPDEIFLVMDATIGQQAGKQAKAFHDAVGITGVIITKMDGSAKGGGALSAVATTGAPVVFIGTGEHIEDLEHFNPTRFISRLLGMGDLETLLETAKQLELEEEKAEKVMEKMLTGKFNLKDMYDVWEQMSKPGILQKILYSLPFFKMGEIDKNLVEESEEKLRRYRVILDSMTYEELENPEIIKGSRIKRVAIGSGKNEQDVRNLLKEYHRMKKMMKEMRGNRKLMRALRRQMKSGNIDLQGLL